MLNRIAESLFWIGRYMERAENHARLIDVNYHMRHELKGPSEREYDWKRLVETLGDDKTFKEHNLINDESATIHFLTFDQKNSNSIFNCVKQARGNVRTMRERISGEFWEAINTFYLWLKEQDMNTFMQQSPHVFYQRIKEEVSLLNGIADSTMLRGNEWNFIQVGKYLERSGNMLRILQVIHNNHMNDYHPFMEPFYYNRMIVLLKSVGGYEAFRKFYADEVKFERIFEFLMLNTAFPRSVSFAFASLESCLHAVELTDLGLDDLSNRSLRLAGRFRATPALLNKEGDFCCDITDLLNDLLSSCDQLGLLISKIFFQEVLVGA